MARWIFQQIGAVMKFGVYPPTMWPDYGESNVQTAMFETAKAAEALKYDAIWANDNVVATATTRDATTLSSVIEPLITLASFIHVVPNINLGLSVLVLPQRNVFIVAKQIAALDLLSDGRFTLGIGSGWREDEFGLLGADFANRGAITDEGIQVLRTLWRDPVASYDGRFHKFSNVLMFPKPAAGGPPIWVGGNTRAAIRRAAAFGDAWVPFGVTTDDLKDGITMLHNLTVGRSVPTIAAELVIHVHLDGKATPTPRAGFNTSFDVDIEGYPEEIIQALTAYQQAGLEYVICIFYVDHVDDLLEQMRVFAEQIMPHFSDAV